jgi:hypothetical protein
MVLFYNTFSPALGGERGRLKKFLIDFFSEKG